MNELSVLLSNGLPRVPAVLSVVSFFWVYFGSFYLYLEQTALLANTDRYSRVRNDQQSRIKRRKEVFMLPKVLWRMGGEIVM